MEYLLIEGALSDIAGTKYVHLTLTHFHASSYSLTLLLSRSLILLIVYDDKEELSNKQRITVSIGRRRHRCNLRKTLMCQVSFKFSPAPKVNILPPPFVCCIFNVVYRSNKLSSTSGPVGLSKGYLLTLLIFFCFSSSLLLFL